MGNQIHDLQGGGSNSLAERAPDPNMGPTGLTQGTIERWRVRSGFIGNTLGIGRSEQSREDQRADKPMHWEVPSVYAKRDEPHAENSRPGGRALQLLAAGKWS